MVKVLCHGQLIPTQARQCRHVAPAEGELLALLSFPNMSIASTCTSNGTGLLAPPPSICRLSLGAVVSTYSRETCWEVPNHVHPAFHSLIVDYRSFRPRFNCFQNGIGLFSIPFHAIISPSNITLTSYPAMAALSEKDRWRDYKGECTRFHSWFEL